MEYGKAFVLIAAAFSAALIVLAAAFGISKIGAASVENIARQPEAGNQIRGAMLIAAALVEGVALFALVICFLVQQKIVF